MRLFVNVTLDNVPPNETLSSLYSTMIQVTGVYVKENVFNNNKRTVPNASVNSHCEELKRRGNLHGFPRSTREKTSIRSE